MKKDCKQALILVAVAFAIGEAFAYSSQQLPAPKLEAIEQVEAVLAAEGGQNLLLSQEPKIIEELTINILQVYFGAFDAGRAIQGRAESSRGAEVRGETLALVKKLIELHVTQDNNNFSQTIEEVGNDLLQLEQRAGKAARLLEKFLVSLVADRDAWRHNERPTVEAAPDERGWLKRLLDWITGA